MKKMILSTMVLALALSFSACKKAYECSCETTRTVNYEVVMSQYQTDVTNLNTADDDDIPDTDKTVISMDKTSKANANETCSDEESTYVETKQDLLDRDGDKNNTEAAYTKTTVTKKECALKKTK